MRERTGRKYLALTAVLGSMLVAAFAPAHASAKCADLIIDFSPGLEAIRCTFADNPEDVWVVPPGITKPTFTLAGADDELGGSGGFLRAKLPVASGEELHITVGGEGTATSVVRDGQPLLIAEGGAGALASNYLSPDAELLENEEPHQPLTGASENGEVTIEWYDRRPYFNLTDPLPDVVIDDFDDVANSSFDYAAGVQVWNVPAGMDRVAFELFGGAGASTEPRAHILAGFKVEPGEQFGIEIGGLGQDSMLYRSKGWWDAARAVGGDTERDNWFSLKASPAEVFWEGGGTGSEPGVGHAIVHYWKAEEPDQGGGTGADPDPAGPAVVAPIPTPAPFCIVPRLRGKSVQAARKTLSQADCALGKVDRKRTGLPQRARIVRQLPSAGATIPASRAVNVVVGSRR